MGITELANGLKPDIPQHFLWRFTVSSSILGILIWIIWAMGAFSAAGYPGLATAGRLDAIETKQEIGLRLQLANEICRLYFLRMDANGEVWQQFNESFNKRQEEYAAVNDGARYPTSECSRPR